MTQDINFASNLYTLYYNNVIVACCFVLPLPNGYLNNAWRIHRLVVNPDYQGLGIGTKFLEKICDMYIYHGARIYIRTSHIKLKKYFENHKEIWVETARSGTNCAKTIGDFDNFFGKMKNNIAYSYKFIGETTNDKNLKYDLLYFSQGNKEIKNENNMVKINIYNFI